MKQYEKPLIEVNSELAEGVYAASGIIGGPGQEQGGVQNPIIPPQGAPDNNGNHNGNGNNGNHYGHENGNNGNGYGQNSGNHYGSSDGNNNGNHYGAGDF